MNTIIEKIRAEVERLKEEHQVPTFRGDEYEEGGVNGYQLALDKLLAKLSDLEKEEKPSDGLEEEITIISKNEYFDFSDWKAIARHFAKWGAERQKEQMMNGAVEGTVMDFSSNRPRPQVDVLLDPYKYHTGDKVHAIIVKEEGK